MVHKLNSAITQDVADRSELSKGSYEQTVTKDYMRHQREGDPPALLLVIDISVRSYNVGLEGFLSSHISGYLLLRLSTCYSMYLLLLLLLFRSTGEIA